MDIYCLMSSDNIQCMSNVYETVWKTFRDKITIRNVHNRPYNYQTMKNQNEQFNE